MLGRPPTCTDRPNRSDRGSRYPVCAIIAYLPSIFRGNRAMPLLRAALPFSGDMPKGNEVGRLDQLRPDRPAAIGGVGRVVDLSPVI